jgi:hypothetical protein
MYNSGNSSKNVTGASVVDGTLYTVDIADDAVTADKLANSVNTDIGTGVTASTTAGDALPKAGGTMTGTIAGFTSTGIDDNATSTAITISALEQVTIDNSDSEPLHLARSGSNCSMGVKGTHATTAYFGVNLNGDGCIGNSGDQTAASLRVTPAGDVRVSTGNLVIGTSGKGIDFSAATPDGTGTTGAEILDDYEEGTWTPTFTGGTTAGDTTYTNQVGTYTKVGRLVTIQAYISVNLKGTISGTIRLTGLPFTSLATSASNSSLIVGYARSLSITAGESLSGTVQSNNTYATLQIWNATTGNTNFRETDMANGTIMMISATYMSA